MPESYLQMQRRIDAEAVLRACGCRPDRLPALADRLARSTGPLGPLAGQLLAQTQPRRPRP